MKATMFGMLLAATLLAACNDEGQPVRPTPPVAAALMLDGFDIKTLRFSWTAAERADGYRLMVSADGSGPFEPASPLLAGRQYEYTAALHRLTPQALFRVDACNGGGCVPSAPVPAGSALDSALGFFKSPRSQSGELFGTSVAISGDGDTLAVGASLENSGSSGINSIPVPGGGSASGAVFVYVRTGNAWALQAYVKASNPDNSDRFGSIVSLDQGGDTLAVWAPHERGSGSGVNPPDDDLVINAGAVYVYGRSGTTWTEQARIKKLTPPVRDEWFGAPFKLSDDGNTLAIGVSTDDGTGTGVSVAPPLGLTVSTNNSGAVYVYVRNGSTWSSQAYIKSSNSQADDNCGGSLALARNGNLIAMGCSGEDGSVGGINPVHDEALSSSGAIAILERSGTSWTETAFIKLSAPQAADRFGATSISRDGSTLMTSAARLLAGATYGTGKVGEIFTFSHVDGVWREGTSFVLPDRDSGYFQTGGGQISGDGQMLAVVGSVVPHLVPEQDCHLFVYRRAGNNWALVRRLDSMFPTPGGMYCGGGVYSDDGLTLATTTISEDSSLTGVAALGNTTRNTLQGGSGAVLLY